MVKTKSGKDVAFRYRRIGHLIGCSLRHDDRFCFVSVSVSVAALATMSPTLVSL
jgi:hypothetical protein